MSFRNAVEIIILIIMIMIIITVRVKIIITVYYCAACDHRTCLVWGVRRALTSSQLLKAPSSFPKPSPVMYIMLCYVM